MAKGSVCPAANPAGRRSASEERVPGAWKGPVAFPSPPRAGAAQEALPWLESRRERAQLAQDGHAGVQKGAAQAQTHSGRGKALAGRRKAFKNLWARREQRKQKSVAVHISFALPHQEDKVDGAFFP